MIQVSLVGFFVGGAFLSLAYYDVPYNLLVAVVLTRLLVEKELTRLEQEQSRLTLTSPATSVRLMGENDSPIRSVSPIG